MKNILTLLVALLLGINNAIAQDDKEVTLTTLGTGTSKEEAKNNALRGAIEQAFGTFVSANTSVVNDQLIKDEIINVNNGNIKKFTILSENKLPDNSWIVSLMAVVSPSKLAKFCESKGIKVDFKGALFAANVKFMELNKTNEVKAINNLYQILCEIVPKCYNYAVEVSEPKSAGVNWKTEITVNATFNDNIKNITDLVQSTLSGLTIPTEQLPNYEQLNVKTYNCYVIQKENRKTEKQDNSTKKKKDNSQAESTDNGTNDLVINKITLRERESIEKITYALNALLKAHCLYFKISNGIQSDYGYAIQCIKNDGKSGLFFNGVNTNYSPKIISKFFNSELFIANNTENKFCYKEVKTQTENINRAWFNYFDPMSTMILKNYNDVGKIYLQAAQKSGINGTKEWDSNTTFFNLFSLQNQEVYFKIKIDNYLTSDEISKVSEFKVEPVVKKNWFEK